MRADDRDAVAEQFGVSTEQVERDHLISHLLAVLSERFADRVHFIFDGPHEGECPQIP